MQIKVREIAENELDAFIDFPFTLYKEDLIGWGS